MNFIPSIHEQGRNPSAHPKERPMPSNSPEYQREYRKQNAGKRKFATVPMSREEHRDLSKYAKSQGLSLAALLREATLHQARGSQIRSKAVEEQLTELRFLVSNVANNMNQIAHHSNRVKHVVDENGVLQRFAELDALLVDFVDSRLKTDP
jgi:hypothetical protein